MRQRAQRGQQVGAVSAHFNAQGALPGSGQHLGGLKRLADACGQPQPFQARRRQHDGRVLTFVELAQARVQIAAQRFNLQIRPQRLQQHQTAQARRADDSALRQIRQRGKLIRHQRVARVFALQHAGQRKAVGQVHRHVFERMHGDVGASFCQRNFEFLDEQPFAADFAQ